MAVPGLHALSCSKCGASLSLAPGQEILTCQYCAQAHVFVPPPRPERPGTVYTAGPSRIRHISQATSRMPGMKPVLFSVIAVLVLVFGGTLALRELHSEAPVAVQAPAAEPPAAPDPYREGERVQIEWHGSWFPGTIIEVNGARYKVTYDGYSSSWDEWVEAPRLSRQ